MNLQDNEMDNLFRSKLEGLEVEPSAHVWENISREIGAPQQRKSIIPILRIAASVAVLIGAGLYFIPKQQPPVQGTKGPKVAVVPVTKYPDTVKPDEAVQPAQTNTAVNVTPAVVKAQATQQVASVVHHTAKVQPVNVNPGSVTVNKTLEPVKPVVADPQQVIAAVDKPKAVINPVVPDGPISKPMDVITGDNQKGNVLADAQVNADEDNKIAPVAKKRKATGLGGFLNKVIAAVDKRDDKIIEFTDTDEGDTITGINLGIFKVKKQK